MLGVTRWHLNPDIMFPGCCVPGDSGQQKSGHLDKSQCWLGAGTLGNKAQETQVQTLRCGHGCQPAQAPWLWSLLRTDRWPQSQGKGQASWPLTFLVAALVPPCLGGKSEKKHPVSSIGQCLQEQL